MVAEIIAVGTELLLGEITNTNAQYISGRLADIGIDLYYQTVVGDNTQRLKDAIATAYSRADCIIFTGGLGPTLDDLTKETIADYFNLPLEMHEESLIQIEELFKKINRPMAENNKKQAMLPKGCMVLKNDRGTAPGCIIQDNGKIAVMLPGPPKEMEYMFSKYTEPFLKQFTTTQIYSKTLRIFGQGESTVAQRLSDIMDNAINPTVAPYAKEGEVTLRVSAKCAGVKQAEALITPVVNSIEKRLGNIVYGYDDESMEKTVVKALLAKGLSLATAESCTGGLISELITSVPGASDTFVCGYITYSNKAKTEMLGVSEQTLKQYGAVSWQTAVEMAEGALKKSGADVSVAVTGIAGPGGGTIDKPVGLVYVGFAAKGLSIYKQLNLNGERERIRKMTALSALNMIRLWLMGEDLENS